MGPPQIRAPQDSYFASLVRSIVFQQLAGKAAAAIHGRFVAALEGPLTPENVLAAPDERLRAAGLSLNKLLSLRDLSAKVLDGTVPLDGLEDLDDDEIVARVSTVRGIGRWTVEMMLMFQLGRPDILPVDDFGVRAGFRFTYALRKMPAPKVLAAYGLRWAPHRTAAAWYLWRAVELKRAGTLPMPTERVRLPRIARKRRQKPRP